MLGPKSIQRFLHQNKGIPYPTRSHGLICREEGQSSTNKSTKHSCAYAFVSLYPLFYY